MFGLTVSPLIFEALFKIFWVYSTVGLLSAGYLLLRTATPRLKVFGTGVLLCGAGFAIWTAAVFLTLTDVRTMVLIGLVLILMGHLDFAKVALTATPHRHRQRRLLAVSAIILVTLVLQNTLHPVEQRVSAGSLVFFYFDPIVRFSLVALISLTLLPASRVLIAEFVGPPTRTLSIAFHAIFVSSVVLVSTADEELLLLSGVVFTGAIGFAAVALSEAASGRSAREAKPER